MDSIRACAKINLHLEVLNKRVDGYHNIFTLMAGVDLHDLLKLDKLEIASQEAGESSISIVNNGGANASVLEAIPEKDNIITKAAELYFKTAGISGNASFILTKNIPSGAGMAGGSTDAAAALRLLNRKLGRLSDHELMSLGSRIGADVPFCLCGGFALCEGIGDIVEVIPGTLDSYVLIANDGIHVNTGEAYGALKRSTNYEVPEDSEREMKSRIRSALEKGSLGGLYSLLRNDFEDPVFASHPELKKIKEECYRLGADFSAMTGSGSSIIALFNDETKADNAQRELKKNIRQVIKTVFLNSSNPCLQGSHID
ncbi:MAG TPA: 4-(cytidine 5'-diphospho)-2-C-methyl-D-erythritol kinase [Spirochaetota bacterium]|nr:4-(cytidine 5'-diphospho)-2-C-methyl-D-erythritol kinase [Spirochaetota bacterium]HPI89620.1 4-(cytidine 5'-diphospho)-2-C-methyl-D-erythritol kinase [Spirochaetota bacterium]HPR49199.1 4-(cytidine 5'-diphospho)-2-C-methyl-D-erythritol kinase [Spirochaetota bacterium]